MNLGKMLRSFENRKRRSCALYIAPDEAPASHDEPQSEDDDDQFMWTLACSLSSRYEGVDCSKMQTFTDRYTSKGVFQRNLVLAGHLKHTDTMRFK